MRFSELIRKVQDEQLLSNKNLAQILDISEVYVAKLVKDNYVPSVWLARKFGDIFGIDVETMKEILKESEEYINGNH